MVTELGLVVPSTIPNSFVSKISSKAYGDRKTEMMAHRILEVAKKMKLTSGRGPLGITAASFYIASVLTNHKVTQSELAEIANITEVTIRNRYKELLEKLEFTIPL